MKPYIIFTKKADATHRHLFDRVYSLQSQLSIVRHQLHYITAYICGCILIRRNTKPLLFVIVREIVNSKDHSPL